MTPERPVLVWGGTGSAKMLRPAIAAAAGRVAVLVERNDDVVSPFPDALRLRDEADVAGWVAERGGGVDYVLAIGGHNGFERLRLAAFLDALGLRPLTLVHDRAWVAATAMLGPGCQIMPMAAVGEDAVLGAQCVVNTNASVDHDCRLGDGVHVMPGATLAGCVTVENGATIGSNATVLPRVRIGAGAQVGAGAVVVRDVLPGMVMVGVPAHVMRGGELA